MSAFKLIKFIFGLLCLVICILLPFFSFSVNKGIIFPKLTFVTSNFKIESDVEALLIINEIFIVLLMFIRVAMFVKLDKWKKFNCFYTLLLILYFFPLFFIIFLVPQLSYSLFFMLPVAFILFLDSVTSCFSRSMLAETGSSMSVESTVDSLQLKKEILSLKDQVETVSFDDSDLK